MPAIFSSRPWNAYNLPLGVRDWDSLCFTKEETEAQEAGWPCLRLYCWSGSEPGILPVIYLQKTIVYAPLE